MNHIIQNEAHTYELPTSVVLRDSELGSGTESLTKNLRACNYVLDWKILSFVRREHWARALQEQCGGQSDP